MIGRLFAGAVIAATLSVPGWSQVQTVQRTVAGPSDHDIQVAVYLNVQPDCTSGVLPAIQLERPPSHGKVVVKKANVSATNYKKCLAIDVPAFVAFYRSQPGFRGVDALSLQVSYPGGRKEVQEINVTVGGPSGPQQN